MKGPARRNDLCTTILIDHRPFPYALSLHGHSVLSLTYRFACIRV